MLCVGASPFRPPLGVPYREHLRALHRRDPGCSRTGPAARTRRTSRWSARRRRRRSCTTPCAGWPFAGGSGSGSRWQRGRCRKRSGAWRVPSTPCTPTRPTAGGGRRHDRTPELVRGCAPRGSCDPTRASLRAGTGRRLGCRSRVRGKGDDGAERAGGPARAEVRRLARARRARRRWTGPPPLGDAVGVGDRRVHVLPAGLVPPALPRPRLRRDRRPPPGWEPKAPGHRAGRPTSSGPPVPCSSCCCSRSAWPWRCWPCWCSEGSDDRRSRPRRPGARARRRTWCSGGGPGAAAARLGIAGGAIVSADDLLVRAPTLRSERLGLVGRCDHLLRVGDAYVPVEQKPSARRLQPSHVMQVGALCLLVEDVYGVRPPYGVVVLAGGAQERIAFSEALERGVLRTMADMRRSLATGAPPGPRWVAAKCRACGYRPICWDDEERRWADEHVRRAGGRRVTPAGGTTCPASSRRGIEKHLRRTRLERSDQQVRVASQRRHHSEALRRCGQRWLRGERRTRRVPVARW